MTISRPCKRCGSPMRGRSDKVYCSDRCRFADWTDGLGERRDIRPCRYCGLPSDTIDHIPPQSVRPFLQDRGLDKKYLFIEVWCCRECNNLLGARALWTVERRKAFIKTAMKQKYAKFLRMPEWTDSEIAKLGPGLQPIVLNGLAIQELILGRLRH